MKKARFTIDEKFIDLMQNIYLSNYIIVYIDDTFGNVLENKELSIIYNTESRKPRLYAKFLTFDDLFTYIKNVTESDNTIKHIKFNVNNVIFCLAKREVLRWLRIF